MRPQESINYLKNNKIGFVGAGNMANSIISGLVEAGMPQENIFVSNPSQTKLDQLLQVFPFINISNSNLEIVKHIDFLVLAVKPQTLRDACSSIVNFAWSHQCIISVAAGVTTGSIEKIFGRPLPIIRSMPNTPSKIGYGATGLFANLHCNNQHKKTAESIFNSVGISCWIGQESQMDLVTAVSGSGPAHFYLYLESMINSAVKLGMDENTAKFLATQTALGAAAMIQKNDSFTIEQLRQQVTSPGGTTAAALEVLNHKNIKAIIDEAIHASVKRGSELAR